MLQILRLNIARSHESVIVSIPNGYLAVPGRVSIVFYISKIKEAVPIGGQDVNIERDFDQSGNRVDRKVNGSFLAVIGPLGGVSGYYDGDYVRKIHRWYDKCVGMWMDKSTSLEDYNG